MEVGIFKLDNEEAKLNEWSFPLMIIISPLKKEQLLFLKELLETLGLEKRLFFENYCSTRLERRTELSLPTSSTRYTPDESSV